MQIQQSGISVNTELIQRLKIGGRWYGPGSVVALHDSDAQVLEMRGIARRAKPGAKPLNVEEKKPEPPKPPEEVLEEESTIKASMIPVQTKETDKEVTHGPKQSHRHRR